MISLIVIAMLLPYDHCVVHATNKNIKNNHISSPLVFVQSVLINNYKTMNANDIQKHDKRERILSFLPRMFGGKRRRHENSIKGNVKPPKSYKAMADECRKKTRTHCNLMAFIHLDFHFKHWKNCRDATFTACMDKMLKTL